MILVDWVFMWGSRDLLQCLDAVRAGFERDTPLPMRKRKVDDRKW